MAVVNLYSTTLTNLNLSPPVRPAVNVAGARIRTLREYLTVGTADSANSTYLFCRVPSNAIIQSIRTLNAAQAGSTAVDLGIFKADGTSTVVSQTAYATGFTIASADTVGIERAFANRTIDKIKQAVWQDAGVSADPGGFYDLGLTITTIGVAGGLVGMLVQYVVD